MKSSLKQAQLVLEIKSNTLISDYTRFCQCTERRTTVLQMNGYFFSFLMVSGEIRLVVVVVVGWVLLNT